MSKRALTQKEKEKRIKKGLLAGAAVVLAAAVVAIVIGVIAAHVQDEKEKVSYEYLRDTLINDYLADPWDGAKDPAASAEKREGVTWAIFEGLMCVEDDGMKKGSKGIEYSESGDVLCVDLTALDEEEQNAAARFFEDYSRCKFMTFRTGTMNDLKKEGKIDKSRSDAYTEGCLLTVGAPEVSGEEFSLEYTFYYNGFYVRGATVRGVRSENFADYVLHHGMPQNGYSDDGVWTVFIEQTLVS